MAQIGLPQESEASYAQDIVLGSDARVEKAVLYAAVPLTEGFDFG
jgi:hypothetical protein